MVLETDCIVETGTKNNYRGRRNYSNRGGNRIIGPITEIIVGPEIGIVTEMVTGISTDQITEGMIVVKGMVI